MVNAGAKPLVLTEAREQRMTNYAQGRRAEYRTMRLLESLGYICTRSASSKGPWDVVGVSSSDVVLVQVKTGKSGPSRAEVEELRELKRPQNCRIFLHWWKERTSAPEVTEL